MSHAMRTLRIYPILFVLFHVRSSLIDPSFNLAESCYQGVPSAFPGCLHSDDADRSRRRCPNQRRPCARRSKSHRLSISLHATYYPLMLQTIVGISNLFVHLNPTIFPEPHSFKPDRWLEKSENGSLDNWLVAFSKGPRSCLGIK